MCLVYRCGCTRSASRSARDRCARRLQPHGRWEAVRRALMSGRSNLSWSRCAPPRRMLQPACNADVEGGAPDPSPSMRSHSTHFADGTSAPQVQAMYAALQETCEKERRAMVAVQAERRAVRAFLAHLASSRPMHMHTRYALALCPMPHATRSCLMPMPQSHATVTCTCHMRRQAPADGARAPTAWPVARGLPTALR